MKRKPRTTNNSARRRSDTSPAHVYHSLVAKLNAARVRRETLHGREYLVVPTTIMRPDSVMNGSKGPLLYPRDEVAKHPGAWNGMPLLHNHPTNGSTGRTPENVRRNGLGYCYNDRVTNSGARVVDAWFDVKLVKAHDARLPEDRRILPRLESGQPVDVSTGLFTDDRPHTAYKNALRTNRGQRYEGVVATNYRPDHLAVLPVVKGACSAKDGCGVGVTGNRMKMKAGEESGGSSMTAEIARVTGAKALTSEMLDDGLHHHLVTGDPEGAAKKVAAWVKKNGGDPETGNEAGIWTVEWEQDGDEHMVHLLPPKLDLKGNARADVPPDKACHIMRDGSVKGHPLTKAQRGMFGALCGTKHNKATKRELRAALTYNRDWPQAKRDALAAKDFAGPGQSFPIATQADVDAAKHLVGKAADPEAVKTRIMLIARRKGLTVPESWNSNREGTMTRKERKAKQVKYLTANCECWKGAGKAAALNGLAEDVVDGLYRKLKDDEAKDAALNAVRAELGIDDGAEVTQELVANALNAKACDMAEEMSEGEGEGTPTKSKKKGMGMNADDDSNDGEGTVDLKDVFKQLPPDQQASLNRMFKRDKARKAQVINELKSIAKATKNARKKDRIEEKLANNAATIEDLEELLDLVGDERPQRRSDNAGGLDFLDDEDEPRLNDYRAMGGGGPRREEADDELLREPTENEADAGSDMDGDAGDFGTYGRNRFVNNVALNGKHAK